MPRQFGFAFLLLVSLSCCAFGQQNHANEGSTLRELVRKHQFDLQGTGKAFLLDEAQHASFFLVGELHGENEIPELLRSLWPTMWQEGYRFIAAEVSPWAADQLEFETKEPRPPIPSLWSQREARFVHSFAAKHAILWGCDMEEFQPQSLISTLATANRGNPVLGEMLTLTKSGYQRDMAPRLLGLARQLGRIRDVTVNDVSLQREIEATLEIDGARLHPEAKYSAQWMRESLMKRLFLQHYEKNLSMNPPQHVLVRFGRNHLHRGYDSRGVSTLGNFIAEFATNRNQSVFNVAAFGAGGKASLLGESWDADERNDDLAFAFLAAAAEYPATVFDLRPLRPILHEKQPELRSPVEQRLIYWADSYDAIICYKNVTPRPE